jgi:hypothetical protein
MGGRETVTVPEAAQFQPRVGLTREAMLQWSLDFAQRDLDSLTEGDWFNLRREFVVFRDPDLLFGGEPYNTSPRALPSPDDLREIQRRWHDLFGRLLQGESVKVGPLTFSILIRRVLPDMTATTTIHAGDPEAMYQLLTLLGNQAHRVAECPEAGCRRWFVVHRAGQVFCGRQCQMRAVMRAKRERDRKQGTKGTGRPRNRTRKLGGRPARAARASRSLSWQAP